MGREGDLLRVDVAELRRRPGTRRDVRGEVGLDGIATSSAALVPGRPVGVDLVVEAVLGGVVAEGRLRARWAGGCRRCLEEVEGDLDVGVREVFEPDPTEGETYPLGDDPLDLEPMVRDALLLALPLVPLCGPGCRGPAPDAFPTGAGPARAGEGGGDGEPPPDPRWAALSELDFDPGGDPR